MVRYTDLFTELVRVEIELWNALDAHLVRATGISLPQFQTLASIRDLAGMARVQDVSERMAITVGATSKVIDRLERDGLAVRSAHPTDRRSSFISLTSKGASALTAAEEAAEYRLRTELGGVLSDESAQLLLDDLVSLRHHSRAELAK